MTQIAATAIDEHLDNYLADVEESSTIEMRLYSRRELLWTLTMKYGDPSADGKQKILRGDRWEVAVNTRSSHHAILPRERQIPVSTPESAITKERTDV